MSLKITKYIAVLLPLLIAGCGDGWETRPYTKTPYDGERTAGRGVEYVRAHLAPPATLKVEEPAPAPAAAPEPAPAPAVTPADPLINKALRK